MNDIAKSVIVLTTATILSGLVIGMTHSACNVNKEPEKLSLQVQTPVNANSSSVLKVKDTARSVQK